MAATGLYRESLIAAMAAPTEAERRDVSVGKEHMPALDGVRGLAALAVVVSHLPGKSAAWDRVNFGACGVLLFFALSGFLMAYLHLHQAFNAQTVRRFCVARVARIVPLYYLVVVLSFLVSHFVHQGFHYPMDAAQLVRHLAFVGSVGVFWSVGPEFQFYGFFVLLWGLALLRGTPRTLALCALGLFVVASYVTSPALPGVLFVTKLHIFLAGVAVAMLRWRLLQRPALLRPATIGGLQLLACLGVVLLLIPYQHMLLPLFPAGEVAEHEHWYYSDLARTLMAALAVLAFSFRTRVSDALLANAAVRELGRISFSLYLLHMPVLDAMQALGLFGHLNPWIAGIGCVLASVALAALVNRAIETPARRWVTRRLGASHPVPAG